MKWTYLMLAALASVATACVVDLEDRVTCPTRTISNITANVPTFTSQRLTPLPNR